MVFLLPSILENCGHVNVLLNNWNINVKFQEVLQIYILGQRGSANKIMFGNPRYRKIRI